jgi:RNA polymerase sigma-54 factor
MTLARARQVLHTIQRADPIGVACAGPQEAMLVQLEAIREAGKPLPPLAERLLAEHFDLLMRKKFAELAARLGASQLQVRQAAHFIGRSLNPYPARTAWGGSQANPDAYYTPDVIISCQEAAPGAPLMVEIASPYRGSLHINPLYARSIQEAEGPAAAALKQSVEEALCLIKGLQQRSLTFSRLLQTLAVLQREYILRGDACLSPLTQADMAHRLGVHESTISRAVNEKVVQLPNGRLVRLKRFFDRSLHVRKALRDLVAAESAPLSDAALAEKLAGQGFTIARRTVAKYREIEKIPPAHQRRQQAW